MTSVVHGRVQGVGFRFYTLREARRLGLSGWVRNEADGTVTVFYEGTTEQVYLLQTWLEQGPPSARVQRVDTVKHPGSRSHGGEFRIC